MGQFVPKSLVLLPHQGSPRAKATYMDYLLGSTWNLIARAGGLAVMPWNLLNVLEPHRKFLEPDCIVLEPECVLVRNV